MFWEVLIITIAAVAFFAVAMSLTLIFKGHHIRSEVSDNPAMRAAGVSCPIKEATPKDCPEKSSCAECKVSGDRCQVSV